MLRSIILASAVITASLGSAAYADEENPHSKGDWVSIPYTVSYTGSALSAKNQGVMVTGEVITTNNGARAGNVAIVCLNNTMALSVAYEPVDLIEFIREQREGRKKMIVSPVIKINGKKTKTKGWVMMKETKVMLAHGTKIKRKLYNAAIRGDEVLMDTGDHQFYLNLPKPNRVFGNFGWPCGLGTGRKKAKPDGNFVPVR